MQTITRWAKARKEPPTDAEKDARLAEAYRNVFSANGTREDAEIVLVDLAVYTRFYQTTGPGASDDALRNVEGRRAVMHWLVGHLADPRILGELQVAAAEEAVNLTQP